MTKKVGALLAVACLVVGFGLGVYGDRASQSGSLSGLVYDTQYFAGDVYNGLSNVLMMRNGALVGPISLGSGNAIKVASGTTVVDSSGIVTGVIGGSQHTTLQVTTSTALASNFDCLYDTIQIASGSINGIVLTLPAATSTAATCLIQDSAQEATLIINNSTNTVAVATSTNDLLAWNATSTAGGATIAAGSATNQTISRLGAWRIASSSIAYTLENLGVTH